VPLRLKHYKLARLHQHDSVRVSKSIHLKAGVIQITPAFFVLQP